MPSVTVILTCHNRKDYTERCIRSLSGSSAAVSYVIVDDGSTDGTAEMLERLNGEFPIQVVTGNGSLFWSGGMHAGIEYAKEKMPKTQYYLLVNDDVVCAADAVQRTIKSSIEYDNAVVAGVTVGSSGEMTYGGVCYKPRGIEYELAGLNERCDTFNCNFVLLPQIVFSKIDNFDIHYTHAMADFDYGLQIKKAGFPIITSDRPIGICERNKKGGTWLDTSLGRRERLRLKESPKGLPGKEWYYFLKKNFGLKTAMLRSVTPYVKILLGK